MKKLMKKVVSFTFVVVTLVLTLSLAACNNKKQKGYTSDNTKFVIGMTGPLTGPAAVYGIGVQKSGQLAVDEINALGGINGMKFEFRMLDDQHDSTKVPNLYSSLYEGGMQVSLGTVTSAPGKEFKELSHEDNVFFITPSATADEITKYSNGYQMCFSDSGQGTGAAVTVNQLFPDGKTIGLFYKSDDIYSSGITKNFKAALNKNIEVVEQSFTDANSTDFSSQIEQLKDCDFIFMPIYYGPASTFIKQGTKTFSTSTTFFGCDGFDGIESVENFKVDEIPQKITMLSHFNSGSTEGKSGEFVTNYTAKYGTAELTQFGASAYDCVYAIYNAMKEIYEADNSKIYVTMSASELSDLLQEKFKTFVYKNGVTGNGSDISWAADGTVAKTAIQYPINAAAKGEK